MTYLRFHRNYPKARYPYRRNNRGTPGNWGTSGRLAISQIPSSGEASLPGEAGVDSSILMVLRASLHDRRPSRAHKLVPVDLRSHSWSVRPRRHPLRLAAWRHRHPKGQRRLPVQKRRRAPASLPPRRPRRPPPNRKPPNRKHRNRKPPNRKPPNRKHPQLRVPRSRFPNQNPRLQAPKRHPAQRRRRPVRPPVRHRVPSLPPQRFRTHSARRHRRAARGSEEVWPRILPHRR